MKYLKKKVDGIWSRLMVAMLLFLSAPAAFAAGGQSYDPPSGIGEEVSLIFEDLGNLFAYWITGQAGWFISMLGFFIAILTMVATRSIMPFLWVMAIVLILAWGPGFLQMLLSAEVAIEAVSQ